MNRIHDLYPNNRYRGEIILYNKNGVGENILDIKRENDFIKLRHRVGMIFQKPTPFPMSIYDNVAYGLKLAGIKSKSELDGRSWGNQGATLKRGTSLAKINWGKGKEPKRN